MSHELSFRENGEVEMVYVHRNAGDVPWHGYGTPIADGLTIEEAIIAARLDWPVIKAQVKWTDEAGNLWPFPERFVTYRGDRSKGLGIVGPEYHVVQNIDVFRSAAQVAKIRGASVETMGALFEGRCVWALIQLPGTFNVRGDKHLKYLLVHSSHDGTSKVRIKVTAVRVVCKNTVDCALGGEGRELAFAHTSNFDDEIKKAEGLFEAAEDVFATYQKTGERLQGIVLPEPKADVAIETFAKKAMWTNATREELENALVYKAEPADLVLTESESPIQRVLAAHEERRLAAIREVERKSARYRKAIDLVHARLDEEREGSDITAWALAQSMTGYADHERSSSKGERRFSSLMLGTGDRLKKAAFEIVEETVASVAA